MRLLKLMLIIVTIILTASNCPAESPPKGRLHIGWAQVDITPQKPVALIGQMHKRISKGVKDPLTATALALETRNDDESIEQAIMVSCDVIYIRKAVTDRLKKVVKSRLPDFDSEKIFMNASHTHTAPGFIDGAFKGRYDVSKDEGVMRASEYADLFIERVAEAAVDAWKTRKPGAMSWGLGYAVVGMNRRSTYFDGSAAMYGATSRDNFKGIEGYQDHGVEMLFFWGPNRKLTGLIINIACPTQETENLYEVSADFWHEVRIELRKRTSKDLFVFPQTAAAGDISPHLMYRKRAEDAIRKVRGLTRRQEIARRITDAVMDVLPVARQYVEKDVPFEHAVAKLNLPRHEGSPLPFAELDTITPIEFHVLRLGDIAIATNPFELYIEYGVRIKARSPAALTFLVQTSCQVCGYLPTAKAIEGGGYSAEKFIAGPEGGQLLVEKTVRLTKEMWD